MEMSTITTAKNVQIHVRTSNLPCFANFFKSRICINMGFKATIITPAKTHYKYT